MITPFFTTEQDEEYVYVNIKVSHVRFNSKNMEMAVDDKTFVFSLSPYYLRIHFPHSCVDDERATASYDSQNESIRVKLPKETKGQDFPDLDLAAKLLTRSDDKTKKPLIEELDTGVTEQGLQEAHNEINWEIPQQPAEKIDAVAYGFNNAYSETVGISLAKGNDINELGDPENTPETDRVLERLIKENIKFDMEYYAADYVMADEEEYRQILEWKSPTTRAFKKWYKEAGQPNQVMPVEFTKDEQEKMQLLPKRSYLVDNKPPIFAFLLSLLFAFHYDMRETEGEHNVESAWTVGKLVPQICYLDSRLAVDEGHNYVHTAIITGIRRALAYPLHRNWDMAMKAWDDVYYNLRGGKRLVLKSVLNVRELFRYHDVYYVYDHIWIQDLCAYVMGDGVTETDIRTVAHELRRECEKVTKETVTFEKMVGDDIAATSVADIEEMVQHSEQ